MADAFRFAAPALLNLRPPPDIASPGSDARYAAAKALLVQGMASIGIEYDVGELQTDPAIILLQRIHYVDDLRRRQMDDLVTQTYLGSASGSFLDARAADYGVLRRTLPHTLNTTPPTPRPASVPVSWYWDVTLALWVEDDASLRAMARLAWEALSVAGPRGAYAFHAGKAHPLVLPDATGVYGPEIGFVDPGEVLVVVQANTEDGVPNANVINSVAAHLDAHEVIYSDGSTVFRTVRDEQSIRPLGARVIVQAVEPVAYSISAKLFLRSGPDAEAIRLTAVQRLQAYINSRKRVGVELPLTAIIAALHVADVNGLPVVEEVEITAPTQDIMPGHTQLAQVTINSVEAVIR